MATEPEGRITCPYCDGVGRIYSDDDNPAEPCMACREDGYLDPGDDGYEAASDA